MARKPLKIRAGAVPVHADPGVRQTALRGDGGGVHEPDRRVGRPGAPPAARGPTDGSRAGLERELSEARSVVAPTGVAAVSAERQKIEQLRATCTSPCVSKGGAIVNPSTLQAVAKTAQEGPITTLDASLTTTSSPVCGVSDVFLGKVVTGLQRNRSLLTFMSSNVRMKKLSPTERGAAVSPSSTNAVHSTGHGEGSDGGGNSHNRKASQGNRLCRAISRKS